MDIIGFLALFVILLLLTLGTLVSMYACHAWSGIAIHEVLIGLFFLAICGVGWITLFIHAQFSIVLN